MKRRKSENDECHLNHDTFTECENKMCIGWKTIDDWPEKPNLSSIPAERPIHKIKLSKAGICPQRERGQKSDKHAADNNPSRFWLQIK